MDSGTPAGSPSRMATSSGPCDSPAVNHRSMYRSSHNAAASLVLMVSPTLRRMASMTRRSLSSSVSWSPETNTRTCRSACHISISNPDRTVPPAADQRAASARRPGVVGDIEQHRIRGERRGDGKVEVGPAGHRADDQRGRSRRRRAERDDDEIDAELPRQSCRR